MYFFTNKVLGIQKWHHGRSISCRRVWMCRPENKIEKFDYFDFGVFLDESRKFENYPEFRGCFDFFEILRIFREISGQFSWKSLKKWKYAIYCLSCLTPVDSIKLVIQ